jgi:hypothetical protein
MGSGFRTFTAGEVLTASNVQNYLMDQSVMVFADSTARATNIGTANFEEGMVSYLENTDQIEVYNGTAWASIAPASTQGLTLLQSVTFSGVSAQSVNDVFSAEYDNYRIVLTASNSVGNADVNFRLRVAGADDSSANYHRQRFTSSSTSNVGTRTTGATVAVLGEVFTSNSMIVTDICLPFSASPTTFFSNGNYNGTSPIIIIHSNFHNVNTSYTGFTLFAASNNFVNATVSVYGYNK